MDVDVEHVQLLVALGDCARRVNPDEGVFRLGVGRGLVDADAYGELVLRCGGLEAQDELGFCDGFAEGFANGRVGRYVVTCFWEEEGDGAGFGCFLDEATALF